MKIEIYTDGACSGNPGKGGYGIVMRIPEKNYEKHFSKGFRLTTNNRMELLAIIVAFSKLKSPQNNILIYTDSKYVVNTINEKWLQKWVKKEFKGIKNIDLWKDFIKVSAKHSYKIEWIKGHSGNTYNEIADNLAVKASKKDNLTIDSYFEALKK